MRAKKIGYFLSVLLLSSAFMCTVDALPDTTATFRGGGVTISMTFPEEAHPADSIWHNITLTAIIATTLQNFTVVITAPVNSSWVGIFNAQDTSKQLLPRNYNFSISLPQEIHGTLQCFIYVNTSRIDDLSTVFYTTLVSYPTFSEMFADYTVLQANYTILLNEYDSLLANYSSLFANYTSLLSQYNALSSNYNAKVAAYQTSLDNYNTLSDEYDALDYNYKSKLSELGALQLDYNDLNSTHNSLQDNYTRLQADYDELNQTYTGLLDDLTNLQKSNSDSQSALNNDRIVMLVFVITLVALIAFIIYLKRGKEEPYVVIRKETVSMNQDENS
jgi:hypothetical protein